MTNITTYDALLKAHESSAAFTGPLSSCLLTAQETDSDPSSRKDVVLL